MPEDLITCPLIEKPIQKLTCEDVSLSAEKVQPARFAPEIFRAVSDWENICLNCDNHSE